MDRNILNSIEVIFHISKKGIKEADLIKEIVKMRGVSGEDAEKSIRRALSLGTIIKDGELIKVSPKIKFLK